MAAALKYVACEVIEAGRNKLNGGIVGAADFVQGLHSTGLASLVGVHPIPAPLIPLHSMTSAALAASNKKKNSAPRMLGESDAEDEEVEASEHQ